MKARLRFHLGKGENYMKWQLRHQDGTVEYIHPDDMFLTLSNVKLRNQRKVADKIYKGENKTVCAWIEFDEHVDRDLFFFERKFFTPVSFNPRLTPYWTQPTQMGKIGAENMDGQEFEYAVIQGTSIHVRNKPKDKMKTFKDLEFIPHETYPDTGVAARLEFPNGEWISVIGCSSGKGYLYGNGTTSFEVMSSIKDRMSSKMLNKDCHRVRGWMSKEQVTNHMRYLQKLNRK